MQGESEDQKGNHMERRRGFPPLLFSNPFQIIAPSSSPLPGTSISMEYSRKTQISESTLHTAAISVRRDWQCPGDTHKAPRKQDS